LHPGSFVKHGLQLVCKGTEEKNSAARRESRGASQRREFVRSCHQFSVTEIFVFSAADLEL
jgi:hypothetical protein